VIETNFLKKQSKVKINLRHFSNKRSVLFE